MGILSPSKQVEAYLKLLVELVGGPNRKSKRARAITALAALVGVVSMARAKIRCMPSHSHDARSALEDALAYWSLNTIYAMLINTA